MTIQNTTLEALYGWSTSYQFTNQYSKEKEIARGAPCAYLTALPQGLQLVTVTSALSKLVEITLSGTAKKATSVFTFTGAVLSIPCVLLAASIKEGHYSSIATWLNRKISHLHIRVPTMVNKTVVSVAKAFITHSGDVARVAMITISVALIYFGNMYYGGAALFALGFELCDSKGYIPRKISLFAETYFPTISLFGMVAGGILVNKVYALMQLPFHLVPHLNILLHQKIDTVARGYTQLDGPSLAEMDAPLVTPTVDFTYEEIQDILSSPFYTFTINPAYCSKWATDYSHFPTDYDFSKLLTYFDMVDWTEKSILKRLLDDDRFIEFFNEKSLSLAQCAAQANKTMQQFASDWMRTQMIELIAVLKGEKRVVGSQEHLEEAILMCSKLLPVLTSTAENNKVDFEDILLKLTIEGGGYCARAIKRVSGELMPYVIGQKVTINDPQKQYELNIREALQQQRSVYIQHIYKEICTILSKAAGTSMNKVTGDIHGFDMYRLALCLGFYPVTPYERAEFTIGHLYTWQMLGQSRQNAYRDFYNSLFDSVKTCGEVHFGTYILKLINDNTKLTQDQKQELLDLYTECTRWGPEDTQDRFSRLLFLKIGVIKKWST